MARIIVVSDSHLSPRTPEADTNWDATVDHIERERPDLVVHTGDISLNGASDPAELVYAKERLDRLSVPWLAVPGNHDVGDMAGTKWATDDDRRRAYEEVFGHRFWVHHLDRWRLIGFDSQDLLSDPGRGQAILDRVAGQISAPHPILVFHHRPLGPAVEDEVDSAGRYVTEPVRSALRRLLQRDEVVGVVSGHVHQSRDVMGDGIRQLWAPTTWATMADWQPEIGAKTVGVLHLELSSAPAEPSIHVEFVVPAGMGDHVLGETIPSPYGGH